MPTHHSEIAFHFNLLCGTAVPCYSSHKPVSRLAVQIFRKQFRANSKTTFANIPWIYNPPEPQQEARKSKNVYREMSSPPGKQQNTFKC